MQMYARVSNDRKRETFPIHTFFCFRSKSVSLIISKWLIEFLDTVSQSNQLKKIKRFLYMPHVNLCDAEQKKYMPNENTFEHKVCHLQSKGPFQIQLHSYCRPIENINNFFSFWQMEVKKQKKNSYASYTLFPMGNQFTSRLFFHTAIPLVRAVRCLCKKRNQLNVFQ